MLAYSLILLVIAGPALWLGMHAAMQAAAEEAVDTQLRAFGLQVRAAMVSAGIGADQPGPPTIALGDVEWVWQVSVDGAAVQRSTLLRLSDLSLSPGIDGPTGDFVVRFAETPLGRMRIAERVVDEWMPEAASPRGPVHYLVGIREARYHAMVADYVRDLGQLTLLITAPVIATFALVFAILLVALRRSLSAVERSLERFRAGETEQIDGRFPRELQDLVDRVNDLLGRNARLLARTRRYVSKIAHDLNHPLTVLGNGLPQAAAFDPMRHQVERMAGLIDRYASLALAMGAEAGTVRRIPVRPVLDGIRDGYAILFRQPPVQIAVDCAEDLSFQVPQHDLEAAVGNLVGNAHRFAAGRIEIAARRDGDDLVVSVDDDGPGIAEDQRAQALRWGERLDEAPPGTGIGLAIVSDLVGLHGGTLSLDRSRLGGLRAELCLPGPGAKSA